MTINPIPAFQDNYIWCINQDGNAWVVDPGCADSVLDYLSEHALQLAGILITHHHWDHTGGVEALLKAYPGIQVIGPDNPAINGITKTVGDGDTVSLAGVELTLTVMAVPGHTLDHIAYVGDGALFCGDTLFSGGCGRLFEGSAEQMYQSLSCLVQLPDATKVYCTHEYTLANLAFALAADPTNQALADYQTQCQRLREANTPTLPSTIGVEKAINPFLRVDDTGIKKTLNTMQPKVTGSVARFAALRQWKDNF